MLFGFGSGDWCSWAPAEWCRQMMGVWRAGIANREAGFRAGGEVQAPLARWMVMFRTSRLRL